MHLSASDIASFRTGRETILIGTLAAFGVQNEILLLRERTEIRRVFDRLVYLHQLKPALRRHLTRWGLDPAAATLHTRTALPAWPTEQAMRGSIAVAVAPDPGLTFSGVADTQEKRSQRPARCLGAPAGETGDLLPAAIEERFIIVLQMVPDHLEGETQAAFMALIDQVGMATIAGGLLLWIAAHFVPGVNIAVLAFDLFMLSGEVLRAIEALGRSIDDLHAARHRSDLEPIAKMLAAALAVLIVNGVLSRFLKARKVPRGQAMPISRAAAGRQSQARRTRKRGRRASRNRRRRRRTRTRRQRLPNEKRHSQALNSSGPRRNSTSWRRIPPKEARLRQKPWPRERLVCGA